jgi:hypothetical protein
VQAWQELLVRQPDCQLLPVAVLQKLGRVFQVHCDNIYGSVDESDRTEVSMCLESLVAMLKLVKDVHPHKFWTFLSSVGQFFILHLFKLFHALGFTQRLIRVKDFSYSKPKALVFLAWPGPDPGY